MDDIVRRLLDEKAATEKRQQATTESGYAAKKRQIRELISQFLADSVARNHRSIRLIEYLVKREESRIEGRIFKRTVHYTVHEKQHAAGWLLQSYHHEDEHSWRVLRTDHEWYLQPDSSVLFTSSGTYVQVMSLDDLLMNMTYAQVDKMLKQIEVYISRLDADPNERMY